jgi:hypothetical protein
MRAHKQQTMKDRPAKSLCMDHTFEVAKRTRNPNGSQAYCALCSMMNEQVSFAFKAIFKSKSLKELVEKIEEWRDHQIEIGNEVRSTLCFKNDYQVGWSGNKASASLNCKLLLTSLFHRK